MVRQPLAHRIATDDALNSVTCYLPLFDRKALTAIKSALEGTGPDNGQTRVAAVVVTAPSIFDRNPKLDAEVFDFVAKLPSVTTPDRTASPLRRARTLARLLADDGAGPPLLANAAASLTQRLNARLDGLAAEHKGAVEANVTDMLAAEVRRSRITTVGEDTGSEPEVRRIATHARDVTRDSQRIINAVREGVGKDWFAHRIAASGSGADRDRIRVESAALLRIPDVTAAIDETATAWVQDHLDRLRVEILAATGATRDNYTRVKEQTTSPEEVTVELRANERAATARILPDTPDTSSPMRPASSPWTSTTGNAAWSKPSSSVRASWLGTAIRAALRRPRCASPTRTTRATGPRSSRTSWSFHAATMVPWPLRSSIPMATT
jgi:hypothetical protein